jgi:glycosyltransferase involved in cell wall biosynthesis
MTRIPESPPQIAPLPITANRPLFSVMIPSYNCSNYLVETLHSVLQQDLGEALMQIEVVDDCSTDTDVEALVKKIGKGRVRYFRQPKNVGSLRNFETCINRSNGSLIHLLHGDDRVKPGFYAKMNQLFVTFPEAGAAFCRYNFINGKGEAELEWVKEEEEDCILPNWLLRIGEMQRVQYASIVVKREVYEKIGSFYGMSYAEDWEMWVRIARFYPVAYTPELLAEYRTHSQSLTQFDMANNHLFGHINKAIKIIQSHLPEESRKKILKKTQQYYARVHITYAQQSWKRTGNKELVKKQLKESLALNKSPLIIFHVLKLYGRMYLGR